MSINQIVRVLGCLMVAYLSTQTTGASTLQYGVRDKRLSDYCPSYCDNTGNFVEEVTCISPPYCCVQRSAGGFEGLKCCENRIDRIDSSYRDGHNCKENGRNKIKLSRKRRETKPVGEVCPAFCVDGSWHEAVYCMKGYCCEETTSPGRFSLICCSNSNSSVVNKYKQGHNCRSADILNGYWSSILYSGIVLGGFTLLLSLCIYCYQCCKDGFKLKRHNRPRPSRPPNNNSTNGGTVGSISSSVPERDSPDPPSPPSYDNINMTPPGPYSSEPIMPPPYSTEKPPPYVP
ncbi:unnamed protein product [Owenia fusiformis]|uniref:Uncharacterized protein n=1 Tax=Owenia fusiformis TaxID=6347 RepID=A0A8J1TFY9_OWEFU|nr:unnamed protein product [Owenia fusiformis]